MKTQTKSEVRNNTAKAAKLLRGLDNEMLAINKAADALNKRSVTVQKAAAQVSMLLVGISNAAMASTTVVVPKTVAKKTVAKKAAKTVLAKKPSEKVAKPVVTKEASKAGRPPLVQLINAVLDQTPNVTAAAVNTVLLSQGHKFSRQSQYNQLNKSDLYVKTGDGATATFRRAVNTVKATDADADAFVERASSNPVTAAVV